MQLINKKVFVTLFRIMILIPLLIPVSPVLANGVFALGDKSAGNEKCMYISGQNRSPVDGQGVIDRAIDISAVSESLYCKDSCYSEGENSCQDSCLHETSTAPVLLGRTSLRSRHEESSRFFSAINRFSLSNNFQPSLRPPIS